MESKINTLIRQAEEQWLDLLEKQAQNAFSGTFLPSHDVSHHRRVWDYSKMLLEEISSGNDLIDRDLVEGLLISSFFHDLGMTENKTADHGRVSRQHCEYFFGAERVPRPVNHEEILHAVEYHDQKNNGPGMPIPLLEKPPLLTLLSIADDLDALGITGIYRYAEIYLHRGIGIKKIGICVLENVTTRFHHFEESCIHYPEIVESQRKRYAEIVNFYDQYNQQLVSEPEPGAEKTGPVGIINYIRQLSVDQSVHPFDYIRSIKDPRMTKFVRDFFISLKHELKASL
ncbi:MAG: HD domain-containing protein [Bacteroidales bacterium]|nr:HD domain-containing protein [Bacteroidales bacterium]